MTARLRLCLLTDSPVPSGLGEHMLTLADGLRGRADVTLAAPQGAELLARAARAGHAVRALSGAPEGWLARQRFDVAHIHAGIGWEGHGLTRAARQAGIPAVLRTEHLPDLLTDPAQRATHAGAMADLDALICVSDHVARSHLAAGVDPSLVRVVRNGVAHRPPARRPGALRAEMDLANARVLLMIARFAPQKEHALLLDALPAVLARHPSCAVLLVGDGPLQEDVARAVAARGLAGCVRLLGPRDDCAELMAAADLLVLPSRFEGLPLVLLEALAAGLPVVATNAPGIDEAIEHGRSGWLSPVGDAAGLAANLVAALDADPAPFAAAGRARHAAQFQAGRMIDETAALYPAARDHPTGDHVTRTRIGFIGAGGIAQRHFGVLERFEDVEITAVCDTDFAAATAAAARFGAHAYTDVAAMLDAAALDAVFICVPPFAHGDIELAVIARDLPFFVEKPVAIDLDTAERVAAAVAARKLVTAVGYHWRYLDTTDEVARLLSANPARLMSGYWLDSTPPPRWWWRQDRSGGQMVEQTTHLIDLARCLAGEVVQVYGMAGHTARADYPGLDVATVSTASLQFASGAVANLASTCLLGWSHRVGLHVFGDRLAIELTDHDLMVDIGRGRPVRRAEGDPVEREDRDFIDAVRGGPNRIRCPYDQALATHRVAMAVVQSAATGRAVSLAPTREQAYV